MPAPFGGSVMLGQEGASVGHFDYGDEVESEGNATTLASSIRTKWSAMGPSCGVIPAHRRAQGFSANATGPRRTPSTCCTANKIGPSLNPFASAKRATTLGRQLPSSDP